MSAPLSQDSDWMSRVSRRKLAGAAASGSRDTLTLHRWVLLRNQLLSSPLAATAISSQPSSSSFASSSATVANSDDHSASTSAPPFGYASSPSEEEVFVFPDADIFEFPDAASLTPEGVADEAAWLEAVLDQLDNDDEEDDEDEIDYFDVVDDDGLRTGATALSHHQAAAVAFSASAPAPPGRVSIAPELTLPLPLFSASPTPQLSSSSSSVLTECNCTTPPPTPSSSPRTPSQFADLPFGESDSFDDTSDDESEGPETPLNLSTTASSAADSAEPGVVLPDTEDFEYSYLFRQPIARSPLSPSSPYPFPLQEC